MSRSRSFLLALVAALPLGGIGAAGAAAADPAAAPAAAPPSSIRSSTVKPTTLPTNWACYPGRAPNPCEISLQTTVLSSAQLQPRVVDHVEDPPFASDPPIDCFYVYPTVTSATGPSAPRHIDHDIENTLRAQAAPFSQTCRVFAPIYRQASITDTARAVLTKQTRTSPAQDLAYSDVLGAWRDYLAHDNHGRGVMLVGHSQGSGMLLRLMTEDMDGPEDAAVRSRLVGAILPGANVAVRKGETTGGNFASIPLCTAEGEAGCVTSWSMYGRLPGRESYFGRIGALSRAFGGPAGSDLEVACTNPAALSGDGDALRPFLRSALPSGFNGPLESTFWNGRRPTATTPWVIPGDHLTVACERSNGANFLRLRVGAGTKLPVPVPAPEWGLHIGEMQLVEGNLVRIAARQSATWLAAHPA